LKIESDFIIKIQHAEISITSWVLYWGIKIIQTLKRKFLIICQISKGAGVYNVFKRAYFRLFEFYLRGILFKFSGHLSFLLYITDSQFLVNPE